MYFSFKPRVCVCVQCVSKTLGQISGVSAKQYMAASSFFVQPSRLSELNPSDFYMWRDLIALGKVILMNQLDATMIY